MKLLTKDEERVLRTRIAGWSVVQQSMEMGLSTATISRIITNITKKYISVAIFIPRHIPTFEINLIKNLKNFFTKIK